MNHLEHSPKTVWLIGMGPSCYDIFAPLLTQEATPDLYDEIWAINMAANVFHHDVVFWMDDLEAQEKFKPGLISMLRRRGKPVITSKAYPEILPNSYDYPLSECVLPSMALIGKPYMTNSVAQAIAYAMHIGVKTLRIYGADFTYPNRDYAESGRACVEFWIALAHQYGMKVELTGQTSLFDAVQDKGIYGYRTQQEITLPNGDIFKYVPVSELQQGDPSQTPYTPEVPNELQRGLPGSISPTPTHSRDAPAVEHEVEPAEPPAVDGPGEGLRSGSPEGRYEGTTPTRADERGTIWNLSPEAGQSLSPGEGQAGPGQNSRSPDLAGPGFGGGNGAAQSREPDADPRIT